MNFFSVPFPYFNFVHLWSNLFLPLVKIFSVHYLLYNNNNNNNKRKETADRKFPFLKRTNSFMYTPPNNYKANNLKLFANKKWVDFFFLFIIYLSFYLFQQLTNRTNKRRSTIRIFEKYHLRMFFK